MSDTPATTPPPELVALVQAAAVHPDPWFSALGRAFLAPRPSEAGVDEGLVARLEEQAAAGDYTQLDVGCEDQHALGPHGPVPLRVYRPATTARAVFVWCHGGGFAGGDLDMPEADATSRELAFRADAIVISVDYRLTRNGVHVPVPHDDVHAAYVWAVETYGAAALGGASAGANLAAGVALRLRDEGRPPLGVVLVYPLVHPVLPAPSEELASKLAVLPGAHAFRGPSFTPMLENYLGAPVSEAMPYAMPGLAPDLQGYPPTLVVNAEYDGLRSSGEAFVRSLEAAGVEVAELLVPDVLHGHLNSPWLPQAQQSYADMAAWLSSRSAQA